MPLVTSIFGLLPSELPISARRTCQKESGGRLPLGPKLTSELQKLNDILRDMAVGQKSGPKKNGLVRGKMSPKTCGPQGFSF